VWLVLIGLIAGFVSALFGVGGGIVVVPLLITILRFAPHAAAATSIAAIGITALAGGVTYGVLGEVDLALAALVGLPAALGAIAGAALQQRVHGRALSYAFAVFLVGVAIAMLV
jgi:uncharacterized protein